MTTAIKMTICAYKAPRKSERTWQAMAKYSVRNRGHQRSALVPEVYQCKPVLAQSTVYQ